MFSDKVNLLCRYCKFQYFKNGHLWSQLPSIMEEKDIYVHGLFCTKFNSEKLLFEESVDIMCIFGSVRR